MSPCSQISFTPFTLICWWFDFICINNSSSFVSTPRMKRKTFTQHSLSLLLSTQQGQCNVQTASQTNKHSQRWTGKLDGWMDRWKVGWIDRWMVCTFVELERSKWRNEPFHTQPPHLVSHNPHSYSDSDKERQTAMNDTMRSLDRQDCHAVCVFVCLFSFANNVINGYISYILSPLNFFANNNITQKLERCLQRFLISPKVQVV